MSRETLPDTMRGALASEALISGKRVDITVARGGGNTRGTDDWPDFEQWQEWKTFEKETLALRECYKEALDEPWDDLSPIQVRPRPVANDKFIFNEQSVHQALEKGDFAVVKRALEIQNQKPFLAHGSRHGKTIKPDWTVTSDRVDEKEVYGRRGELDEFGVLVVGETKISTKWAPLGPRQDQTEEDWKKPVRQVMSYCAEVKTRYGFIVTDKHLVVLRITKKATPKKNRQPAPPALPAKKTADIETTDRRPERKVTIRDDHRKEDFESEFTVPCSEYYDPEYYSIDWDQHGEDDITAITAKSALWALTMLALDYGHGMKSLTDQEMENQKKEQIVVRAEAPTTTNVNPSRVPVGGDATSSSGDPATETSPLRTRGQRDAMNAPLPDRSVGATSSRAGRQSSRDDPSPVTKTAKSRKG